MSSKYSKLFESISIGKVEIKNRIAMAPMAIGGSTIPDGGFAQRAIDYYVERAKGGLGLIITGAALIDNETERFPRSTLSTARNTNHFIETASELTQKIHAQNSKIFVQLTAGVGRVGAPSRGTSASEFKPVAPSPIPNYWNPNLTCRQLTVEEIQKLVIKCGDAAEARNIMHAIWDSYEVARNI